MNNQKKWLKMKKYITLLFFLAATSLIAQEPIVVVAENRPSSLGIQPAFEVMVPQATQKEAIDLWKKTILSPALFKKTSKMKKVKDEWLVNNVVIDEVSAFPMDVITQVSSFPGHIYVRVFLQDENGFLGADSTLQTDRANLFIRDYGVDLYRLAVEKELKAEERKLKSLERDHDKLIRKNKSYNRKMEDAESEGETLQEEARYQQEILNGERVVLPENPGTALEEFENRRDERREPVVLPENPGSERETAKEVLKDTEKEIKKARRAASRFDRKTRKNRQDQKNKIREIEKQQIKVEEVRNKLDNIR